MHAISLVRNFKTWFVFGTQNTVNEIPRNDPAQTGVKAFGSYSFNMKNRIFHFYLGGQSRGIVQSIKLMDNTHPDLKAAVYLKQRPGGAGETDLRSQGVFPPLVFKVEIQTFGCSTFHLGQYIFLDARQYVDAEVNRIFQISGYYRIYKVSHGVGRDNFQTTITAILEESLDDFNRSDRRLSSTKGVPVDLATAGTTKDQGGANITTQDQGLDPTAQKAIDLLNKQIETLAGSGNAGADGLSGLEKANLMAEIINPTTSYITGDRKGSAELAAEKLGWGLAGDGSRSQLVKWAIEGLGKLEGPKAATDIAYNVLENLAWWSDTPGGEALDASRLESNGRPVFMAAAIDSLNTLIKKHQSYAPQAYQFACSCTGQCSPDWTYRYQDWGPNAGGYFAPAFNRLMSTADRINKGVYDPAAYEG